MSFLETPQHPGTGRTRVYIPTEGAHNQPPAVVLELSGRCQAGIGVGGIESAMDFESLVDRENFVLIVPNARRNLRFCPTCGPPFFGGPSCHAWAATPSCCANNGTIPSAGRESWEPRDDVAFLVSLVRQAVRAYRGDRRKVFVFGYSAGGFMAHRLACEHPESIAAVFSLTGGGFVDASMCKAFVTPNSAPVAIAHAHPENDQVFGIDGGIFDGVETPTANHTVRAWALHNGCAPREEILPPLDLYPETAAALPPGGAAVPAASFFVPRRAAAAEAAARAAAEAGPAAAETERRQFFGCAAGGATETWVIRGEGHVSAINGGRRGSVAKAAVDFFRAHPKPGSAFPAQQPLLGRAAAKSLLPQLYLTQGAA